MIITFYQKEAILLFCPKCGKAVKEGEPFCAGCGSPLEESAPAKSACTAESSPAADAAKDPGAGARRLRTAAAGLPGNAAASLTGQLASSQPGEAVLGDVGTLSDSVSSAEGVLNPFKTVLAGIRSLWKNAVGLFRNKQWIKLAVAGVVAVVWVVLMILSRAGIKVGVLNWLTFAQGGAGRGVLGWIGGLLGKTTVATMFFSLFSGGFRSLGSGARRLFSGKHFKGDNLGAFLLGAGGALAVYQFFAGSAAWTDGMAAISGAILSLTALGRSGGFLFTFARSLTAKAAGKARLPQTEKANGLLSGMTCGFTLGALVSLIPFGWTPVILGGACLAAGLVMTALSGRKKEVSAA